MLLKDIIGLIYVAVCFAGGFALCNPDDITPSVVTPANTEDPPQQPVSSVNKTETDPDGSFYKSLKENVNKKTPVDRLDEMSKDVTREMKNNPYYKIPKLDRKLRELAVLHPDVMERLGVYVIPVKSASSQSKNILPADENQSPTDRETPVGKAENPMQSNLSQIIKQSEMIKGMTQEEKLRFIPQLKETIIYEILKNTQTIDSLTAQISQRNMY